MRRDMKLENITNIRQTVGKTGRRVIRFNHEIVIDMNRSNACDFRRLRTTYREPPPLFMRALLRQMYVLKNSILLLLPSIFDFRFL
jgi:hypothetical protein